MGALRLPAQTHLQKHPADEPQVLAPLEAMTDLPHLHYASELL